MHEEIGLISFDQARSQYVLREFHVEGFVNQYLLEGDSGDESTFIFVTESMENIPPGWRARTTLEILAGIVLARFSIWQDLESNGPA